MNRAIATISLLVLCVLIALRPLVSESYDPAGSPMTAALAEVSDPSPVTTLVFDLFIVLASCGWLVLRQPRLDGCHWQLAASVFKHRTGGQAASGTGSTYRRTGLEKGLALLLVAAIVSCVVAGNKRLAINASIDWLCFPLLAIAVVQLAREPWQRRLVMLVVLASATAQSAKCFEDHLVSFDETWSYYQDHKVDFWAAQGVDLDSDRVELFERRMLARESSGFLPHSNVAGSYLVLCMFAGLGVVVSQLAVRRRRGQSVGETCGTTAQASDRNTARAKARGSGGARDHPLLLVLPLLATMCIAFAVVLTKSKGAMLSAVVGIAVWVVAWVFRKRIDANRRRAFIAGWIVVGTGMLAVVGHGLYHGSLPGSSLNFRWQYWTVSTSMIADHGLTGVGRENFGRHYLHDKPIDAPEEVSNPHNLFVQATAEWGVLGLIGIVAMLVGGAAALILPTASGRRRASAEDDPVSCAQLLRWGAAIGVCVLLVRALLLGTSNMDFIFYTTVLYGGSWFVGLVCFAPALATLRGSVLNLGIAVGILTFLVHDMINFAAFVPATAMTMFALFGCAVAERCPDASPISPRSVRLRRFGAAGMLVLVLIGLVPTALSAAYRANAETRLNRADAWRAIDDIDRSLQTAVRVDPFDPTASVLRAKVWSSIGGTSARTHIEAMETACSAMDTARLRDPHSVAIARIGARMRLELSRRSGRLIDATRAVHDASRVTEIYPTDPQGWILKGDALAELARMRQRSEDRTETGSALRDAADAYRQALRLDDARPEWERIRGLPPRRRSEIAEKIASLERLLTQDP